MTGAEVVHAVLQYLEESRQKCDAKAQGEAFSYFSGRADGLGEAVAYLRGYAQGGGLIPRDDQ
jgi:hypothetical protein